MPAGLLESMRRGAGAKPQGPSGRTQAGAERPPLVDGGHTRRQGQVDQQGQAHGLRSAEQAGGQKQHGHKGPAHVDLPLGEINEPQDAIDHGVAQGNEGVSAAGGQAIDKLLQKHRLEARMYMTSRQTISSSLSRDKEDNSA